MHFLVGFRVSHFCNYTIGGIWCNGEFSVELTTSDSKSLLQFSATTKILSAIHQNQVRHRSKHSLVGYGLIQWYDFNRFLTMIPFCTTNRRSIRARRTDSISATWRCPTFPWIDGISRFSFFFWREERTYIRLRVRHYLEYKMTSNSFSLCRYVYWLLRYY